jgi:hypothetical protein
LANYAPRHGPGSPLAQDAAASNAIALAPGGGSGVGIGPAFAVAAVAPRALLHVVAAAASSSGSGSSSSSSSGGDDESFVGTGPGEAERAAGWAGLPLAPPAHTVAAFQAPGPAALALLAGGPSATLWLHTQALLLAPSAPKPSASQTQGFLRVTSAEAAAATAVDGRDSSSALLSLGVGDGGRSGVTVDAAGCVGVGGGFSAVELPVLRADVALGTAPSSSSSPAGASGGGRPTAPLHVRGAGSGVSASEAALAARLGPSGTVARLEASGPAALHLVSHTGDRPPHTRAHSPRAHPAALA